MMPAPGPPNGDGPNPRIDPEPDVSETNSETTSNNSPIQDHEFDNYYRWHHGRQFHAFEEDRLGYFLPADEEESMRLREQHDIFRSVLGEVYDQHLTAVLSAGPGRADVLDLGCGPGTWVQEFANAYESAFFIGIDLVPMARQQVERAQFECFDISAHGIQRRNRNVKVIHARCLSFGYNNQFGSLLRQAYQVLSPGGLLLSIEIDWRLEQQREFPLLDMQATREFISLVAACAMKANNGVAWDPTRIPVWLADAGFQNVQQQVREMPVGPWMGSDFMRELGGLVRPMYIKFARAMRPALLGLPGARPADVDNLLEGVRRELDSEVNTGWSIPVQLVTAFKRETATPSV